MMKEVVRPPLALTDMICTSNLNLVIETFSQLIFSTFIFKIEQFAKSNVPGFVDGRGCAALLTIP